MIYYYFSHFEWILLLAGNKIMLRIPYHYTLFSSITHAYFTSTSLYLSPSFSLLQTWWILGWMFFLSSKWFSWFRLRDLLPLCTLFSSICYNSFLCFFSVQLTAFTLHARHIIEFFKKEILKFSSHWDSFFDIM